MVSFNNIIGHKDIVKHLQNAIKTEKISHSYIFTGRPGTSSSGPRHRHGGLSSKKILKQKILMLI